MIKFLRIVLFPFSVLYGIVLVVRNVLFAKGVLKSKTFEVPVVSIGNITVGGTGKTPHTEYVVRLLGERFRVAVLSRGYGRKTKGFREVTELSLPEQCGDEPCQIKSKFPSQKVVVDEDRCNGITRLLEKGESDVVILDDAYQHRWVKPGLSLLLVDCNRPLFKDFMMPTGNLREFQSGIKRADIVVVTKCPDGVLVDEAYWRKKLKMQQRQDLFFSTYAYGALKKLFEEESNIGLSGMEVLLLTGIANPKPLEEYLERHGATVTLMDFPDHHQFDDGDMDNVRVAFERLTPSKRCVITTEKDAVRLKGGMVVPEILKENLYYVPVEVRILNNEDCLRQKIIDYVEKDK